MYNAPQVIFSIFALAVSIYIAIRFRMQQHHRDLEKSKAGGDVSCNWDVNTTMYIEREKKVLDLNIKITNNSSGKIGVLAAYVKFKPVLNAFTSNDHNFGSFDTLPDFDDTELEKKCSLKDFINIAYADGFIWQNSINETEVLNSFYLLEEEFCKKYPIVAAEIVVYCSSMNLIDKTHYPKYEFGKLRRQWCNYVTQKYKERYDFFSRLKEPEFSQGGWCIKQYERILINKKDGKIDVDNTISFEKILRSVVNYNLEKIIDLRSPQAT